MKTDPGPMGSHAGSLLRRATLHPICLLSYVRSLVWHTNWMKNALSCNYGKSCTGTPSMNPFTTTRARLRISEPLSTTSTNLTVTVPRQRGVSDTSRKGRNTVVFAQGPDRFQQIRAIMQRSLYTNQSAPTAVISPGQVPAQEAGTKDRGRLQLLCDPTMTVRRPL